MNIVNNRLAVLIGSHSRGIEHTHENLEFFLSLFDIDYDIFICSDETDLNNFNILKNIHSTVSLEEIESKNPQYIKTKKLSKPSEPHERNCMGRGYYQNAKIAGAASLLTNQLLKKYTVGLKMRTDFIFDYKRFFTQHGLGLNIDESHLHYLKDGLKLCIHHCATLPAPQQHNIDFWKRLNHPIETHHQLNGVDHFIYHGDRFAISSANGLRRFCLQLMHTAINIEEIYTSYIPVAPQHDYRHFSKHLETIAIPKSLFPGGPPKTGEEIAACFNSNKDDVLKIKDVDCHLPIYSGTESKGFAAGRDLMLDTSSSFNPDILSYINALYTPKIIPSVHTGGPVFGYMEFIKFLGDDNKRVNENTTTAWSNMRISMTHTNDAIAHYRENIQIQNKLKKYM